MPWQESSLAAYTQHDTGVGQPNFGWPLEVSDVTETLETQGKRCASSSFILCLCEEKLGTKYAPADT